MAGHSNHSLSAFLDLLGLHAVTMVAGVRSVPLSKRHPHFCREALDIALAGQRIGYRHFPALAASANKPTPGTWRPSRGEDVIHLLPGGGFRCHEFSPTARVEAGRVTYPTLLDAGK